ncbi:MAG: filamentous hemagglutinin N-terminal domain-containing protein [Candidatus Methylacidiphilales bacterium]
MVPTSRFFGTLAIALRGAACAVRRASGFCAYAFVASVLCGIWTPWLAFANPTGEQVVAGQGNFNRNGSTLTVTQGTDKMIVNWQQFSINPWETTRFVQPSVHSSALNRVVGGDPSSILGTLQANGSIYLINPNGIVVGSGARIDAGSFLASTLDVSDSQFMAGGAMNFLGPSTASVQNLGVINATNGDVILIGQEVINHGEINAPNGTAGLAAGNDIVLMPSHGGGAEGRLSVRVKESELGIRKREKGVTNTGKINAATAELKAAGGNVYALAINNTGTVRANALQNKGGRIFLSTDGGKIVNKGTLQARGGRVVVNSASRNRSRVKGSPGLTGVTEMGGVVDVSSRDSGKGGTAHILGDQVLVSKDARIDASGFSGGGEILIGGDFQGKNTSVVNAEIAFIDAGADLRSDGIGAGDGGKVIVWSDMTTVIGAATLSAKGGPLGGNGGLIETSGKHTLVFRPREVTVLAQHSSGNSGTILLDPDDIVIAAAPGDPFFNPVYFAYSSGTETYQNTMITALSGNIILQAKNNIDINATLAFTQGFGNRIVFQAGNQINVNADVGTMGADLYFEANSPEYAGVGSHDLSFGSVAITTGGGDLHLNGERYNIAGTATFSAHIIFFGPGANGNSISIGPNAPDTIPDGAFPSISSASTTFGRYQSAGPLGDLVSPTIVTAGFLSIDSSLYPSNLGAITYYAGTQITLASGSVTYTKPVSFNPIGSALFKFNPGDTINSSSDLTFNTQVVLGAPGTANINTNGGNLNFNHRVDGYTPGDSTYNLNAGTGDISFFYTVGGLVRLNGLQINNAHDVTFHNLVRANYLQQIAGSGTTTFDGDTDILNGSLTITTNNIVVQKLLEVPLGSVIFNHAGTLQIDDLGDIVADTFTDTGGPTTFASGAFLDTTGDISFTSSSLNLKGATILSDANINIDPIVNLTGSNTLVSLNDIFFLDTVNGPGSLNATAGSNIIFSATPGTSLGAVNLTAQDIFLLEGMDAGTTTLNHTGVLYIGGDSIFTGKLTDNGDTTTIDASYMRADGGAEFNSVVGLSNNFELDASAGFGGITFNDFVHGSGDGLALFAGAGDVHVDESIDLGTLTLSGNQVTINQTDSIELGGADVTTLLSLVTSGPITQTGAVNAGKLTMSSDSSITLTHTGNHIEQIGDVTRGGDLNIFTNTALTISGQINTGDLESSVTMVAFGGDLTLADGANIAVDGSEHKITLATDNYFINEAGPQVFTLTNGAVYNLYAGSDLYSDLGGLSTDFIRYSTPFPVDDNAIPAGNGIFFANSFASSVNNPNNPVYDNFLDAAIGQLDADQPDLEFDTDSQMGLLGDGLGDFTNYDTVVDREESVVLDGGNIGQVNDKFLPNETKEAIDPNVESELAGAMGTGEPTPPSGNSKKPGQPNTPPGEAPGLLTKGDTASIDGTGVNQGAPVPQETKNALSDTTESELEKSMVQAAGLDGTDPFDQVLGNQESSIMDGAGVNPLPAGQVPQELTNATTDTIEQDLTSAMNSVR